jgi:hypothetical protein
MNRLLRVKDFEALYKISTKAIRHRVNQMVEPSSVNQGANAGCDFRRTSFLNDRDKDRSAGSPDFLNGIEYDCQVVHWKYCAGRKGTEICDDLKCETTPDGRAREMSILNQFLRIGPCLAIFSLHSERGCKCPKCHVNSRVIFVLPGEI